MESKYELYHVGVKGMKWGVRRYQNPDGSLTRLGRARMKLKERSNRKKAAKVEDAENKRINDLMRKPVSKLTDAEIAERYARRSKERQLLDMESQVERLSKDPESFVKKIATKAINDVAIPALVDAGKAALTSKIKSTLLDSFGLKNDLKVVKDLSDSDILAKERARWESLGKIATNKKLVENYNKDHSDDQIDDRTGKKREAKTDSNQNSKSNGTTSNSKSDASTSKNDETSSVNKAQKPSSNEKVVDAEYKETGPQRATSSTVSNGKSSLNNLINSGYTMRTISEIQGTKQSNSKSSMSNLSGYSMGTLEEGKSALDRVYNSGFTMTKLSDLEKYN